MKIQRNKMNLPETRPGTVAISSAFAGFILTYVATVNGLGGGWVLSTANVEFVCVNGVLAAFAIGLLITALNRFFKVAGSSLVIAGVSLALLWGLLCYIGVATTAVL